MATIGIIDRARVLLDLVRDGEVTDLSAYATVEKAESALVLKYAQAMWDAPGWTVPNLVDDNGDPRDPTNDELTANYISRLKAYHKDVLAATRVGVVGTEARDTEAAIVAAEGTTDLGDTEPEE
jgi:hypothetical protein